MHDRDTGLTYMGARYYDPVLGRFMGRDPVGFVDSNPLSMNRFAYGNNSPYKFVDPDGRAARLVYSGSYAVGRVTVAPAVNWGLNLVIGSTAFNHTLGTYAYEVLNESADAEAGDGDGNSEAKPGSPALDGDPYSPSEVSKRQSKTRKQEGVNPDPDTPIPDRGPGKNIKDGVHTSEGKTRHKTGERNVSSQEEHSRTAKGNGSGIH